MAQKGTDMLDIKTTMTAVLTLEGRLDTTTSSALEEAIAAVGGAEAIRLDLRGLEYISSAGLRVLLKTEKALREKGGSLTLEAPTEEVMEVLRITGFDTLLTIV